MIAMCKPFTCKYHIGQGVKRAYYSGLVSRQYVFHL